MSIILLEFFLFLEKNNSSFEKMKNELIILEQNNFQRTIIEQNIDKIIYLKLKENNLKRNTNIFVAQKEINQKLLNYLKDKASATNFFLENEKKLSLDYLNSNSVVSIFQTKNIIYSEYVFTSNYSKTQNISQKMGNDFKIYLKIPIDYFVRVIT